MLKQDRTFRLLCFAIVTTGAVAAALASSSMECLNLVLSYGASPLLKDELWGWTPLHAAAHAGVYSKMHSTIFFIYTSLLKDELWGWTPLHAAADAGAYGHLNFTVIVSSMSTARVLRLGDFAFAADDADAQTRVRFIASVLVTRESCALR